MPKAVKPPCFLPGLLTLPPQRTQSSCLGKAASQPFRKNLKVYTPEQGT